MRLFCLIAAALFTLFAYWQLNDLEQYGTEVWYGWLLAYGLVAVVSLLSSRGPMARWVYATGAIVAALATAIRATGIEWDKTILYNASNPAGNETGGLLLIALWMAALTVWASRQASSDA